MVTLRAQAIVDGYLDDNGNQIIGNPHVGAHAFIEFKSSHCRVEFGPGAKLHGAVFFQREASQLHIGARSLLTGRTSLGAFCSIRLGADVYSGANLQLSTAEGQAIEIGDDCLIANDVRIRADDSHPIYDMHSGERINHSASILIEDHVWVGQEVFVMPGGKIRSGSIVGARSMITRTSEVPANSIVAGTPAKVLRSNVHWVRKHLQMHRDIPVSIDPLIPSSDPE
ncbi:acyltransferase [Leucobacter sp. 7(1)]|uniref:acyltransferase n=1 Tax=Leucobacter sp. 7(1) TaxID=1255613 RepID=UPI00111D2AA7|nr:acyltransferase [Leucobacter sp. 7(1)]